MAVSRDGWAIVPELTTVELVEAVHGQGWLAECVRAETEERMRREAERQAALEADRATRGSPGWRLTCSPEERQRLSLIHI